MPETNKIDFAEYRGLSLFHIAALMEDSAQALTYGTPVRFAGAQECGDETDEASDPKFYDNQSTNTVTSEGATNYNIISSVPSDSIKAMIEGREYDEETGIYSGTPLKRPDLAFGFIGEKTNGDKEGVWVYKGKFTGGNATRQTMNNGTDTTNCNYTFGSVYTQNKCNKIGTEPMKFIKIPIKDDMTEEKFISKVWTWKDLLTEEAA